MIIGVAVTTRSWALLSRHEAKSSLDEFVIGDRLTLIVIVQMFQSARASSGFHARQRREFLVKDIDDRSDVNDNESQNLADTSGTDDRSMPSVRRHSANRIADVALIANRRSRGTNIQQRGRSLLQTTFATSVDPYTRSMIEHIPRKLHRSTLATPERFVSLPLPSFFLPPSPSLKRNIFRIRSTYAHRAVHEPNASLREG